MSTPFAGTALALTSQDWGTLGLGDDPETAPTGELDIIVKRATALMLVRCVAIVAPLGRFPDLSTTSICTTALMKHNSWPDKITDKVIDQLKEFVKRTISGYKDVPYHSREHAFHVLLSANKLIDLMLHSGYGKKPRIMFGLRNDPLALFALMFSALVHDVEHQGIPNRQLALEDDRLAVLYNDQSIAENWSLYFAFSELLQDEFQDLRDAIFVDKDEYRRFRKIVVNLVLASDIASPDRTQLTKSKWKEAFGDPFETVERKMRSESRRMSMTGKEIRTPATGRMARRGTGEISEISFMDRHPADGGGGDDDDSLSLTPDNSGHGEEVVIEQRPGGPSPLNSSRRGSNEPRRRMSSMTTGTSATARYRYRLGILRSVDLSGETLESYDRHGSMAHNTVMSSLPDDYPVDIEGDEPDELRATVVMETIMQSADVAHNLQGWEAMVKWSTRLYLELRKAYVAKRGADPQPRWFENQIGFLESYLLPLARKLGDAMVFDDDASQMFARTVELNRDRWLTHGFEVTEKSIEEGVKYFPESE